MIANTAPDPIPTVRELNFPTTDLEVEGISLTDTVIDFNDLAREIQIRSLDSYTRRIIHALGYFHAVSKVSINSNRIHVEADCDYSHFGPAVTCALGAEFIEFVPLPRPHRRPFARH